MNWESLRGAASLVLRLPQALATQGCCASAHHVAEDNTRCPLVLVHGYAGTDAVWRPLRSALADAGFGHVVSLRYNALTAHPSTVTARLTELALAAVAEAGAPGVHLVGHSLGGVLLRAAVARSAELAAQVRGAVTISSPHRGVAVARVAPGPCALWMHPSRRPHHQVAPGRTVRWLAYWSDGDRVVPRCSARLDEKRGARNVLIPGCGHLSICRDPRLLQSVVRELVACELELAPPPLSLPRRLAA